MLNNMTRTTPKVTAALENMNVELYDMEGNFKGLPTILADMEKGMRGYSEEQRNATIATIAGNFGQIAMKTLLNQGAAGWDDMTQSIKDAASAQEIARIRTETYQGKLEAFEGVIESLKIRIGTELLPVMTALAIKFADFIEKHSDKMIKMFISLGATIKGLPMRLKPIILLISQFVDLIKDNKDRVIGAIKGIGAAFAVAAIADKVMGVVKVLGFLTNPIGLIIAAAALLGVAWEENWGGIREIAAEVWETLVPIFESIVEWLQVNIPMAIAFLTELWEGMRPAVEAIWLGIVTAIEAAIGLIQAIWEGILKPIIDSIKIDWEVLGQAIGVVWTTITGVIEIALGIIATVFDAFSSLLRGDWEGFWEGISTIVTDIWEALKLAWNGFWAGLVLVIEAFRSTIEGAWNNFWSGMAAAVMGILGPIVSFIQGIIDGIKEALGLAGEFELGAKTTAFVNKAGAVNAADQAERGSANASGIRNFIVPATPGLSGDAMTMRFRAGERVTVDTPGNAGRGGGINIEQLIVNGGSGTPQEIARAVKQALMDVSRKADSRIRTGATG